MKQFFRILSIILSLSLISSLHTTKQAQQIEMGEETFQPVYTSRSTSITISAAGDVTLGHDLYSGKNNRFDTVYNKIGGQSSYYFANVKSVFKKDDLTLVNFEGTLTTSKKRAKKRYAFKGPYKYINILKAGSIEAVSFANNHCRDYGEQSYKDTIICFKKNSITYASYGTVGRMKVKGKTIGMISVNGLEGVSASKKIIKKGMKKLKNADLIIVSMHCGKEGSHKVKSAQKQIAHYAVNQGADLVLGHHPHVLQGIEKYKGVYIVYSLANFCFGGNRNPKNKDTMIFQKTFHFKNNKLKKDDDIRILPCSISSVTSRNDYRPTILKGKKKAKVISKINSYSKSFKLSFKSSGRRK